MQSTKQQIAERIAELIEDKGMTGIDIARKIDVNVVTLYRYKAMRIDRPHRRILKILRRIK